MQENNDKNQGKNGLSFESLDILIAKWKDGTFSEIIDDWKWIFSYSVRYKWAIVFYTILGIFSTSMGLVSSVAGKYLIDIITGYKTNKLMILIIVMVGSSLFSLLFSSIISRISTKLSIYINNDIQADIFDKIVDADWLEINKYSNGDVLNRFNGDIGTVSSNAISWLPTIVIAIYNFIATFLVILHYNAVMAILALASAPFMLLMSRFMIKKQREYSQKTREMSSKLMTFEVEAFYNFDTIKSFGIAPHYSRLMRWWQGKFKDVSLEYNMFSIKTNILLSVMGTGVEFIAFGYCLFLLWTHTITYGTMTLFLQQRSNLSGAFNNVVSIIPSFLQSAQQMAEVFPYILTSGVLKDVVAEDMGLDSMPGSIDVKADDGTNLLTISVSGNDPQMAYKTLKSVIKNYPKVAEFVLGETKLTILDETGIPTDIKREEVIRGSYKRGALKGAIIGCVILLLYVLSRRTVKSRKDLKKNINLQDLGSIPYVRTKKRKKETFYNSVSLLNERISMSYLEAIRKLRIRIMKDVEKKEYQTLLVTSSIPGEGKTTLSANLAISIAQQGKKVLLVDCDLRNPSIAGVMNEQEPHPGLGSVLKKEVPLSEAITNVKLPKERTNENGSLHVIFGGAPDGENSLLIGSGRMRALIEALKSKYDIIILDTAPSELLADAPLLGKYVDAALYVIRYDYTKLREIREGVESLALSGIDMLGYVFNGDNSSGGQGYGYGYRRYGNYGSYGSHYGSYGKYGAYGHYGKMEKGSTDKFGRVIKD